MKTFECGQSLVEFVFVVPVFFILLSGLISVFYIQNKHFIDFESKISVSISPFLFEQEERIASHWIESNQESNNGLISQLDTAFNPSLGFPLAKNKNEGVFFDKKKLELTNNLDCAKVGTFSFSKTNSNEFNLQTCSNSNGYEKSEFDFQETVSSNSRHFEKIKGQSIFFPYEALEWKNRSSLPKNAVGEFLSSYSGIAYSFKVASLIPLQPTKFNTKCFMEPFNPNCKTLSPYADQFVRAARDGANLQVSACYTEMALKCSKYILEPGVGPAVIAACIVEGTVELIASIRAGKKVQLCSMLNFAISGFSIAVKSKAALDMGSNSINEMNMRKKLL